MRVFCLYRNEKLTKPGVGTGLSLPVLRGLSRESRIYLLACYPRESSRDRAVAFFKQEYWAVFFFLTLRRLTLLLLSSTILLVYFRYKEGPVKLPII